MARAFVSLALAFAVLLFGHLGPSEARPWKPTPLEQAQDYLQIEHSLSDREQVILMWLAPQFFGQDQMDPAMLKAFEDYALVAVIHFAVDDLGQFQVVEPTDVTIELPQGLPLTPLPDSEVPPFVSSLLHLIQASLASGFGPVGQGMKTFVYDGAEVNACGDGRLWIRYLEERYEYEMPVPGC